MTPKTTNGAIEKIYRVRVYVNSVMALKGYNQVTIEQMAGYQKSFELLTKVQRAIGDE